MKEHVRFLSVFCDFFVDTDLAGARTELLKGLAVVRPLVEESEDCR